MGKKLNAFIPRYVGNGVVLGAFELMRKQQKIMKKDYTGHLRENEESYRRHLENIERAKGYIEDQNSYTDMKYGDFTMQFSGCEVFAVFNAMYNICGRHEKSLAVVISEFEKDGMVLSGKFGTSPKALADYLTRNGYITEICSKPELFDAVGKRSDSLILTVYNDREDITKEVHTFNISKERNEFTAHNVYCNGYVVGPYGSVSDVIVNINGGKAKGISLIGICRDKMRV